MATAQHPTFVPAGAVTVTFYTEDDEEIDVVNDHDVISQFRFRCRMPGIDITLETPKYKSELVDMVNIMSGRVENPPVTCSLYCDGGSNTGTSITYDSAAKTINFYAARYSGSSTFSYDFSVRREDIVNELNRKLSLPLVEWWSPQNHLESDIKTKKFVLALLSIRMSDNNLLTMLPNELLFDIISLALRV
jgi:hypothetical protein